MKVKSAGKNTRGFSTLEIIIALALMITVIVGAVDANIASQYWSMTSQTAQEALYKAKTIIEELRAFSSADFQSASTTLLARSQDSTDPTDATCLSGGLCYFIQSKITDISSCSKYAEAYVAWRLAPRYATATVELYTNLTDNNEIILRGGDCELNMPQGDWLHTTPSEFGSVSLSTATGIDVLQKKIYITSEASHQFQIYQITPGGSPSLVGFTDGKGRRLNAVDAVRDLSTGRTYAYVTQHASTSQLAVLDVTDASNPALISERTLYKVDKGGSFPEGWRVNVYGGRVYVTTRETGSSTPDLGRELHIFNINSPTQPAEITSAATELTRTVNDMLVREQIFNGSMHRYLFLAEDSGASPYTKHLRIFDVTNDVFNEVVSVNLTNSANALSLYITGNTLYLGRQSNSSGAELYAFDIPKLLAGDTAVLGTAEVGADISTIRGAGDELFLGTSKSGQQFQVWQSDPNMWNPSVPNAGRISFTPLSGLVPLGIDWSNDFVYLISQVALKAMHIP